MPLRILGIVAGVVIAAGGFLFPAIRFVQRDRALGVSRHCSFRFNECCWELA